MHHWSAHNVKNNKIVLWLADRFKFCQWGEHNGVYWKSEAGRNQDENQQKQDNIFSWIGTLCFGNPVKSLALLSVFILALAGRQTCFSEEPKCGLAVLRCKYTWEHMHQFHKKLKWSHLLHPASNYSGQHFSVQGDDLISWHSIKKCIWWDD